MGILLEIVNRATEITQNRLEATGGTLKIILDEELEKEKQQYKFNNLIEENKEKELDKFITRLLIKQL